MDIEEKLPDYYAILQVHPSAEVEVIKAAYRLLMRRYHPDILPPEQQQDLEVIKRVRLINLAYDILGDPAQRAAYDAMLKKDAEGLTTVQMPGLDTRLYLVRCSTTHNTYKMLLARRAGSKEHFRVTGFELVEERSKRLKKTPDGDYQLALPAKASDGNLLQAFMDRAFRKSKRNNTAQTPPPTLPSERELQDLFGLSGSLRFSEIYFAEFDCPSCHAVFKLPNGIDAHWVHCHNCGRIHCAGNLSSWTSGIYDHCPWCGRKAKILLSDTRGLKSKHVKGEVSRSDGSLPELRGGARVMLPGQKKEHDPE